MSAQRRRRRHSVVSDDESETNPPARRRRYNTRSAVREEARHRDWHSPPTVSVVRLPFLNIDYATICPQRSSSTGATENSSEGASGSRSRDGASGLRSRDGASGSRSRDGASGSRSRDGASGSRSRDGASGSRSRDDTSGTWRRLGASGSRSRDGPSTSAAGSTEGSSRHRTRTQTRSSSTRPAATASSGSPREENASSSTRVRTYTAMSTGGRSRLNPLGNRADSSHGQEPNRSSSSRSLARARPSPPPRRASAEAQRVISRIINTSRQRRSDDEFTAVMRSLELIRSRRRNPLALRLSRMALGGRRSQNGPLSPRPSRGSNIVSRASSSRGTRSVAREPRPALTIEDIIGVQPSLHQNTRTSVDGRNENPASTRRRQRPTARMSTGGRQRSGFQNPPSLRERPPDARIPPPRVRATARMSTSRASAALSRQIASNAQTSNSARTRIATGRSNNDHIRYDMTHTGGRLNIRVAFGTDEDDSETTERLFSMSGDSDATTYLNSLSDIDMSADDVFYSDTDRQESDSGDSSESGSTATPHSLVSLSLNALHPSPTPSLSSAETNHNNMDLDVQYPTEPEPEEEEEEEEEPTTDEVDEDETAGTSSIFTPREAVGALTVGNPIIFLHNNISVHLLSSMAELAETFSSLRDRLQQTAGSVHEDGFRGFTPPRNYPEPTRRRVPEGVDCQRAKLTDELNSNTSECVICTDTIKALDKVWPCNNCFNIFHLPCIRKWAKTNRATEISGAWICPVCRRPKFCGPNKLRYRCLCGRLRRPKPMPGVTPHCCGKPCKHNCGILCHPGPCKMSEAEAAAFAREQSAEPPAPGTSQEPVGNMSNSPNEANDDAPDLKKMSTAEIQRLTRMMDTELRILKSEKNRLWEAKTIQTLRLKENKEKLKLYKTRPYLVSNVVEILDPEVEELEDDADPTANGKTVIVKTSMRQVLYLPMPGIVDVETLKPGDIIGVNKDTLLIIDKLPWEVDPRIKVMEITEKPTDSYTDIGGLDTQIQELIEAIVLPMTQKEKFQKLGIVAPKGVLMYGPPGTGKTLLARACAAQTNAKFLKLSATQLVQMYIGDGAKMVRDAFQLARENAPAIIFIDELDAIGTKRFDSAKVGDREVQRTMMELLNQLDGFTPNLDVKIIAATNRVDSLDPALLRSGRIDKSVTA